MHLLLSKKDSAEMLGISLRKLEQLIAEQQIAVKRIGRRVLIALRTLEEFASRGDRS